MVLAALDMTITEVDCVILEKYRTQKAFYMV